MKKILFTILCLTMILLNGDYVYGNRKTTRPFRQYIDCAPVKQTEVKNAQALSSTYPLMPSPLVF